MPRKDPELSALTGSELQTAMNATQALLNLGEYLGQSYAGRLTTLRKELQVEHEDRKRIAKSPAPIGGRPEPAA